MSLDSNTPQIYAACLASYNKGILHGQWIDATQLVDTIKADIDKMLAKSPVLGAEEYAIPDTENFFGITISENEDLETVIEIAEFLEEHEELGAEVLKDVDNDVDEAKRLMEECYQGEYKSEEAFAYQLADETMEIPESL